MKNLHWTLAALALFHFACSSMPATPPPDAPVGVMAAPADGSVTVSWESSAGATGYTVYYNVDSSGAVSTSSLSVDAGADLFVSISGLIDGTEYAFAVAARGLGGQGALSATVTATPQVNAPIAVVSTSPADAATMVANNPPISITFNRPALPSSLTTQSAGGACSGSVQLSSDSFNTCAGFTGAPVASDENQTFTFTLAQPLQGNTTYALRVTTSALNANGIALAGTYTQAHGFTTAAALAVMSVSPADGAMGVALNSAVTVVFNRSLSAASATGNTSDASCTGSFQLSASAFASGCIKLASVTTTGATVVLTPAQPLPPGALVQLLVTSAVTDADGNSLSTNYSSAGFDTVPPLAVASVNPDGQSNVDFQPTLSVAFATPAAPASITTNLGASTACSGSIQLSRASDAFAANTCVPMSAQPATSDGGTTFTFTPAQRLASSTSYLLRVTTAAQDPSGTPLGATYTSMGFSTRAFAVVSLTPADGASGLSRKANIIVTFNRPVGTASVGTGTCAGPFLLTLAGQSGTPGCTALAVPAISASGTQVTLTPASFLNGGATYQLTITTALQDDSGGALPNNYATSTGFTTLPALAIVSTQPAAGAMNVPLNTNIQVTFNQAVMASSLLAHTASQTGCGAPDTLTLSASGQPCVPFTAQPTTLDDLTFTLVPAAQLTAQTSYTLALSQGVLDSTGAPLGAAFSSSFATGNSVDNSAPGEVTGLAATPALQSILLTWTNPSDPDFSLVNIYLCANATSCAKGNTPTAQVPGAFSAAAQTVLNGLSPYTPYAVLVTTVSQSGVESAGTIATTSTVFSGVQSGAQPDFYSGQEALAAGVGAGGDTISVWFTWTGSALYAGIGNSNGSALLTHNQDVLWIAVDTDPSIDATGEVATQSVGSNQVIWPFKADYVIQLIPNGLNTSAQIHPAGGCALISAQVNSQVTSGCSALSGANNYDGFSENGLDELSIPASALFGNAAPGPIRIAFAALNSTNGDAYALAPANPAAIDALGYFASLTSSFNPGTNMWDPTKSASSATLSPLSQASSLVTLSVLAPSGTTSAPTLKGSLYPLSYTLSNVSYVLRDDGTGGDVTAGDGVYTGAFNFGGLTGPLFFKFGQDSGATQVDEFPTAGVDRVWSLSGAAQTLPQLQYGVVYSKNHSFTLTFQVTNPGGSSNTKEVLGNVGELGNFTPMSGAPLTSAGNGVWSTAAIPFSNHDFTSTPLQWKARDDGSNVWEPSPNGTSNNHSMNDDILNSRTLAWTWDDYSNDPF